VPDAVGLAGDPVGDLLRRPVERGELCVPVGLLDRRQLGPMQVLRQHVRHLLGVPRRIVTSHEAWHSGQLGGDRSLSSAVPEQHQLTADLRRRDDQRLQHSTLPDRGGQLLQVTQVRTRVAGVRDQLARVQIDDQLGGLGSPGLGHARLLLRFGSP
jgi:hypothetical protein